MKPILFIYLFLSLFQFQEVEDVDIYSRTVPGKTTIFGKNNSSFNYEVTLYVNASGYNMNKPSPTKIVIPAHSEISILELKPVSKNPSKIKLDYSIHRVRNKNTLAKTSSHQTVIFTQYGCGRCKFALEELNRKRIPYVEKEISFSSENESLMWDEVRGDNYYGESIQLPVVISKGKVHYNIKNLPSFMSQL